MMFMIYQNLFDIISVYLFCFFVNYRFRIKYLTHINPNNIQKYIKYYNYYFKIHKNYIIIKIKINFSFLIVYIGLVTN